VECREANPQTQLSDLANPCREERSGPQFFCWAIRWAVFGHQTW
jgi:hypothetical protein